MRTLLKIWYIYPILCWNFRWEHKPYISCDQQICKLILNFFFFFSLSECLNNSRTFQNSIVFVSQRWSWQVFRSAEKWKNQDFRLLDSHPWLVTQHSDQQPKATKQKELEETHSLLQVESASPNTNRRKNIQKRAFELHKRSNFFLTAEIKASFHLTGLFSVQTSKLWNHGCKKSNSVLGILLNSQAG